jgi:hypothetical protein
VDSGEEEAMAFIRAELVKSFKNGLMRGREAGKDGRRQEPPAGAVTKVRSC